MILPNDFQIGIKELFFAGFCYVSLRAIAAWTDEWAKDIKRKWDMRGRDYVDKNGHRKYKDEKEILEKLVSLHEEDLKILASYVSSHKVHEEISAETNLILKSWEGSIRTLPAINNGVSDIKKTLNGEPG